MPFTVDPSDPRPIYVQIMDEIRRGIVVGAWREGEALPSARELAVELRVNPNTVQQAYRELESEGVVEGRRGSGTYVRERALQQGRHGVVEALAERVEREAHRAGVTVGELMAALGRRTGEGGEGRLTGAGDPGRAGEAQRKEAG